MHQYRLKITSIMLALLLSGNWILAQSGDGDSAVKPTLSISNLYLGGQGTSFSDYGGKVGEYTIYDEGVRGQFGFIGFGAGENYRFSLNADHVALDDQRYLGRLILANTFKGKFRYDRMRHWLDHDPLAYGVEVKDVPPIRKVYKRDDDPGTAYKVTRSLSEADVELNPPKMKALSVHGSVRNEHRSGSQQAIAFGMCQSCHITSRSRQIDQVTQDYRLGLTIQGARGSIDYTVGYRDYKDVGRPAENFYGDPNWNPDTTTFSTWPIAPQSWSDKRLDNNATLPYGVSSPSRKFSHLLTGTTRLNPKTTLAADAAYTIQENRYSGVASKYAGGGFSIVNVTGKQLTLSANYRFQSIDNDEIYDAKIATLGALMDTSDLYYPTEENLLNSALTRTVHKGGAGAIYRISPRTSLDFGVGFASTDRDNFEQETTKEINGRFAINTRISKNARLKIAYKVAMIDNPFENPRAGREGPPDSTYTNRIYSTFARIIREDPLAADPTDRHEIKVRYSGLVSPEVSFALGGNWKYRKNTDTEWESKALSPFANISIMPKVGTLFDFSYTYQRDRMKTLFSAPDMILKAGQLLYHHGSFYQLIPYDEDAHTVTAVASFALTPSLTATANANYVVAKGAFDTKDYIGVADHADAADTLDLSNLNEFSGQDYRQLWIGIGFEYRIWSNVYLKADGGFSDFQNKEIYLYDMAGKAYSGGLSVIVKEM